MILICALERNERKVIFEKLNTFWSICIISQTYSHCRLYNKNSWYNKPVERMFQYLLFRNLQLKIWDNKIKKLDCVIRYNELWYIYIYDIFLHIYTSQNQKISLKDWPKLWNEKSILSDINFSKIITFVRYVIDFVIWKHIEINTQRKYRLFLRNCKARFFKLVS